MTTSSCPLPSLSSRDDEQGAYHRADASIRWKLQVSTPRMSRFCSVGCAAHALTELAAPLVGDQRGTSSMTDTSGRAQNRMRGAAPPSMPMPRLTYSAVGPTW